MAVVYRAHHEDLDIPVAVKILNPALAALPQMAERFLREARLAAKIDHPNLVRVYDCGEERGRYYLVMELVDGASLADVVAEHGPIPWQEALAHARAVASALEAAWAQQILHRDIKPANILRARDGAVKLADLGLAKCLAADTSLTQSGMIMGTPAYMSPEQFGNQGAVDTRSDIYSLGATLYCLLVGRAPFQGELLQVMSAHHEAARPTPPGVPKPIARLVARMMAIKPTDRPATPTMLIRELDLVLEDGARSATRVASRGEAPRRKAVVAAVIAILAIVVGVVLRRRTTDGAGSSDIAGTGSVAGSTMGVSTTPSGTGSGSGSGSTRELPLAARVAWLGPGRVRLSYDFESAAQRADWELPNSWTSAKLEGGWLVVGRTPAATAEMELALVLLKLPLRVDRVTYTAEIIEGDHLNWYAHASWLPESGEWWPKQGVGGIFRGDDTYGERFFVVEGLDEQQTTPDAPRRLGHPYRMEVEIADDGIVWRIDGQATRVKAAQYEGTDRRFALGAWSSRVRYDDLVIEGRVGR